MTLSRRATDLSICICICICKIRLFAALQQAGVLSSQPCRGSMPGGVEMAEVIQSRPGSAHDCGLLLCGMCRSLQFHSFQLSP